MGERYEIRLAGTGGQGMILAGIILAEAAILDGKNVTQTQSYGPEARGGASRSEVVLCDEEIDYPKVIQADVLLCMSQEACDSYFHDLKQHGLLIVDSDNVERTPTSRALGVPLARWAEEATGRQITASVVALGFLTGLTGIISRASMEAAVKARAPKGTAEINLKALAMGFEQAERFLKSRRG
ncbi:MAG: 2-oxoacid:acceptor oxidoreductase family protein [Anaerolineae bacterium]|nr:2-oxoacid:acceptor oxidoreductase family protein [Anaerolineae bacterium]MDH7475487.1 2-oxoacid:acceptor oxidoreductase family protein [Anaerolineae bacterium]